MALPTVDKTYEFDLNNQVTAQGSRLATLQLLMRTLKDALINSGTFTAEWTVSRSSNGTTADASDNWTADADLVWDTAGNSHSWIVLRQTGISATFEICIDLQDSSTNYTIDLIVSHNTFLGGTTTNRPTATGEVTLFSSQHWASASSSANDSIMWHMLLSTDGAVTRIFMTRNSVTQAYWWFEVPRNAVSGWNNPVAVGMDATIGTEVISIAQLTTGAAPIQGIGALGTSMGLFSTIPLINTNSIVQQTTGNSFSGNENAWDMNLYSSTEGSKGHHAALRDVWWLSDQPITGDHVPSGDDQFVVFGSEPILVPWDNVTTIQVNPV